MKQKEFVLLPVLVFVLILLVGFFVYQNTLLKSRVSQSQVGLIPSPSKEKSNFSIISDTNGRITYTNYKYYYSLSFKPDSDITAASCGDKYNSVGDEYFVVDKKSGSNAECSGVDIRVWPLGVSVVSGNKATPNVMKSRFNSTNKFTYKKIIVGDLDAMLYEIVTKPAGESSLYVDFKAAEVYNPKTNMTYEIILFNRNDYYSLTKLENYFNQILSTFKFANETTLSPTITLTNLGWKVYSSDTMVFKYPSNFQIDTKNTNNRITIIKSTSPMISLITSPKGLMYGECIKLEESKTVGNLLIRKFSHIYEGDMCSGATNPNEMDLWITEVGKEDDFGPGISFQYESNQAIESEKIFNQILPTFKFTN